MLLPLVLLAVQSSEEIANPPPDMVIQGEGSKDVFAWLQLYENAFGSGGNPWVAEQPAVCPPLLPEQFQDQIPPTGPVTKLASPTEHKFVGVAVNTLPLSVPQEPLVGPAGTITALVTVAEQVVAVVFVPPVEPSQPQVHVLAWQKKENGLVPGAQSDPSPEVNVFTVDPLALPQAPLVFTPANSLKA